jgi:hypothetical protein
MGSFKSKSTSTTTPIVEDPMKTNLADYAGKVSDFLATDPTQYVAQASPLQQQAFAGAQDLGAWQAPAQQALGMAQSAGGAGPSTYQAPHLGAAAQAQAAKLGPATQADAVNIAAAPQADAQSLLTNLKSYMNPYTNDVVNSALANYDDYSGQQAASLQSQQARTGAFGGSRAGIAQGQFEADRGRNRAATEYGMRSDAFNMGAALSGQDADRRQNANFFNIGNTQQRNLAQAGIDSNRNLFNAGAQNDFTQQQAGFDQQTSMFNTGAQNQFSLAQGGMDADAARYNAAAQEAEYQRRLQAAGITANIGSNMGEQSRADLGLTADLGQVQYLIDQARLNAVPTQLQMGGALYGAIPQASYIGANNVTKGTTPWGPGTVAAIGNIASSFAQKSERRLKRDIERIGQREGLGLYRYNYVWDDTDRAPRTGVMVDEVERLAPHALGPLIDGDKTVDYAKLGLAHLVEEK